MRPLRVTPGLLTAMGACDSAKRRFLRQWANEEVNERNLSIWVGQLFCITWAIGALFRLARTYDAMSVELKIEASRLIIEDSYNRSKQLGETYIEYQGRASLAFITWLDTPIGRQFIHNAQNKMAHYGL